MARTVNKITSDIQGSLTTKLSLTESTVAEWRLWINIVAIAIHTFELILDQFKSETEQKILETRPGTEKWYEYICYNFQHDYHLVYDAETGTMAYPPVEDEDEAEAVEASKITAVAAVQEVETRTTNPEGIVEVNRLIILRVAKAVKKEDDKLELQPFDPYEKLNFENYINEMKFAGSRTTVISTTADQVYYKVTVYYNPAYPEELVKSRTQAALETFNLAQEFGGILYKARFLEAIMGVDGVTTLKLHTFQSKGTSDEKYKDVDISVRLEAGYFNYHQDSEIEYKPAHTLYNNTEDETD